MQKKILNKGYAYPIYRICISPTCIQDFLEPTLTGWKKSGVRKLSKLAQISLHYTSIVSH